MSNDPDWPDGAVSVDIKVTTKIQGKQKN